jgi:hypothetical protein
MNCSNKSLNDCILVLGYGFYTYQNETRYKWKVTPRPTHEVKLSTQKRFKGDM